MEHRARDPLLSDGDDAIEQAVEMGERHAPERGRAHPVGARPTRELRPPADDAVLAQRVAGVSRELGLHADHPGVGTEPLERDAHPRRQATPADLDEDDRWEGPPADLELESAPALQGCQESILVMDVPPYRLCQAASFPR